MAMVVHVRDPGGFDVYIGRGARFASDERCHRTSPFANPYKPDDHERGREGVVAMYETWLRHQIDSGRITREQLLELDGKRLGCWCKDARGRAEYDQPCHGDIIVKLIEEMR